MNKSILVIASAVSLSLSSYSFAGERSDGEKTNEAIGFGSGAVAGAFVGGPLGAMIGGIFGVLIADDINDEAQLEGATAKLERQQSQLVALQNQYDKTQQQIAVQLVSVEKQIEQVMQEIESTVQFRTASFLIEEHFKPQLDLIVDGLKNNPELVVTLSGYADVRGDSHYNQQLSEQRVASVKNYLLDRGIAGKQVKTQSFGESQPVNDQANREDHFFDRRVLVRVAQGQQSMTASN